MTKLSKAVALCAAVATLIAYGVVRGEDVAESDVKTAFVYNFALFSEWPEGAAESRAPFAICVFGTSPFTQGVASLEGKQVRNRKVAVRRETVAAELKSCQIAVIAQSEAARMDRIADVLKGAAVLTITEDDSGGRHSSVVNLVTSERRVSFDVNASALERARLNMSSKLLRLARTVRRDHDG